MQLKYQIKELELGGILDQAFQIVRDHFGLLFGIVGMTLVPLEIIMNYLQLIVQKDVVDPQRQIALGLIFMGIAILLLPILAAINAAVVHAVSCFYLSKPTTIADCFHHVVRCAIPLTTSSILWLVAVLGGFLLCVVPGIVFFFWFSLCQQVVVVEGLGGSAALQRSRALMKGNIMMAFVIGLVWFVISMGLLGGAAIIPEAHLKVVAVSIVQGISTVIVCAIGVVFYFSCRCRVENFDLQILADAMSAETGDGSSGTVLNQGH